MCRQAIKFYAFLFLSLILFQCTPSFRKQVRRYRQHYKQSFVENPGSPLDPSDLSQLRFYDPDPAYRVTATVGRTSGAQPFEMTTNAGTTESFVLFARVTFLLKGDKHQLAIYRRLQQLRMPLYRDYLFLPFKDFTNGVTTYGGGRYMDFRISDIENGTLAIDFNKAYNPLCAYHDSYQCPIPPIENHLEVAVKAGEKQFVKEETEGP